MAGATGLEPAASSLTGMRSNQTELRPQIVYVILTLAMNTHKNMTNLEIAKLLRQISAAYEVKNEGPLRREASRFRIRAYDNAADSIEHSTSEVKDLWEQGHLEDIHGVGASLAGHLDELFKTGKITHFEQVTKNLPNGMFELLDVQGIGPKTAYKLSQEFKLDNPKTALKKLQQAAVSGKIRKLENFGQESEKDILQALQSFKVKDTRVLLPTATSIAEDVIKYMQQCPDALSVDMLGSLRRRAATIGDVDIAVASTQSQQVINHFTKYPHIRQILAQGKNTARFIHKQGGVQVDIKTQTPDKYGALLQHFTGSKNHNVHLREIAIQKGLSLSEYGIKKGDSLIKFSNEEVFYKALGMQWIPPELREDAGEIEAALKHQLPKLIEPTDIKGDLHTHTNYDWISSHDRGTDSLEAMAKQAIELGYEYIALGDHNPSISSYTKTKIVSEISKRSEQIDHLKSTSGINILKTLEIDIQTDGKLSVPDAGLEQLDFAIISIHSVMSLSKNDMTKRVLAAFSHPKAKILGHPTGRLLGKREGYELDWDQVFEFCAKHNKFLEINAQPSRLDLPDILVRDAIKAGVKLVIDTDAHNAASLQLMRFGVDVARRGWATKADIVNTLSWEDFSATIKI